MKPTVLLMISHGWTLRNYLLSGVMPALSQSCRVVIASERAGDPEFQALCAAHGAEVVPLVRFTKTWAHRRLAMRRELYHFAWSRTETMAIKKHRAMTWHSPLQNFRNRLDHAIAERLAGPRTLRLMDRLDSWYRSRSDAVKQYGAMLARVRPSLVLSTAPVVEVEWGPLVAARRLGIRTAAAVMSWDNLSSKGRLPPGCDYYLVWTRGMADEALRFHPELRPEQVVIAGTAQFDAHHDRSLRQTREAFFREYGLDPSRPLLVYAGVTESLMPDEPRVVARIADAVRDGRFAGNPQLLVRPHPADAGKRYAGWGERHPDVPLVVPAAKAGGDVRRLVSSRDDLRVLINTLIHGDVHMNVASTMTIDAAVLDRPVVNIRFDEPSRPRAIAPGLQIYDYTHYRPVAASGGVRIANSLDELVGHVNAYLANPSLDREGRRAIVERICGPVDGRSAERIARLVTELAAGMAPAA